MVHKILKDRGSDTNLLRKKILEKIHETMPDIEMTQLRAPHDYKSVSGQQIITCAKQVVLDLRLKIRHAAGLMLRNIVWKVPHEPIKICVLGRSVLEAIGYNNRRIIQETCDDHDDDIDVAK